MSELLKSQLQLRTTAQLVQFLRERKARHMSLKSREDQELNPWFHFHLESPPAHPANLRHLMQKSLSSSFCWSSEQVPVSHSLMSSTEIRNYHLVDEGKGTKDVRFVHGKSTKGQRILRGQDAMQRQGWVPSKLEDVS